MSYQSQFLRFTLITFLAFTATAAQAVDFFYDDFTSGVIPVEFETGIPDPKTPWLASAPWLVNGSQLESSNQTLYSQSTFRYSAFFSTGKLYLNYSVTPEFFEFVSEKCYGPWGDSFEQYCYPGYAIYFNPFIVEVDGVIVYQDVNKYGWSFEEGGHFEDITITEYIDGQTLTNLVIGIDITEGFHDVQVSVAPKTYMDIVYASIDRFMFSITSGDYDNDGLPDEFEFLNNRRPDVSDSNVDFDNDGLTLLDEYFAGTNDNDSDSDDDGIDDGFDAFPLDPAETKDSDNDGIGDKADLDDDNDSISDLEELLSGTNPLLADTDNDGAFDNADAFPNDPTESQDSDGDGVGDNADVYPNNAQASALKTSDGGGSIPLMILFLLGFLGFSRRS